MDRNLENPRDNKEALLAAFAGILPVIPNASGQRETLYLAKIQGQDVQLPETDRTRTEMYLRAIAEHGGGGGSVDSITFTGNGTNSIVLSELSGKTLVAAVLADTLNSAEVYASGTIAVSLFNSNLSENQYSAVRLSSQVFAVETSIGSFTSATGNMTFNAILPLGKQYIAFYR